MRRLLRLAATASALLVAAAPAHAYPLRGAVDGLHFGSLTSGMTSAQVHARFGTPASSSTDGPWTHLVYGAGLSRVEVTLYMGRFDDATTHLRGYRIQGYGPGATFASVRKRFPKARCRWGGSQSEFNHGCLVGGWQLPKHRLYLEGPKGGRVRSVWFVSNHAG